MYVLIYLFFNILIFFNFINISEYFLHNINVEEIHQTFCWGSGYIFHWKTFDSSLPVKEKKKKKEKEKKRKVSLKMI